MQNRSSVSPWLWLPLFAAIAAVPIWLLLVGLPQPGRESQPTAAPIAGIQASPRRPHTPIEQIAEAYHANAAGAAERYGRDAIYFTLRVTRVEAAPGNRFAVSQDGDTPGRRHLAAIFSDASTSRLARVNPGDTIRGHGRLSHTINGLVLDDCVLDD